MTVLPRSEVEAEFERYVGHEFLLDTHRPHHRHKYKYLLINKKADA